MATIKDVANHAGVSVATVSRVLNHPKTVRPETRELVQKSIEALSYQPNFLGKNLRQLETHRILVLLSSISNPFYSRVLQGIEDCAGQHEYDVLIGTTRDSHQQMQRQIEMIQSKVVDGAIITTTMFHEEAIQALAQTNTICACEPSYHPNIQSVCIDNVQAAFDATSYLIERGHRRIAIVTAPRQNHGDWHGSFSLREKGYRMALEHYGIAFDETLRVKESLSFKAGRRAAQRILDLSELPDAVFTFSDATGVGLISEMVEQGVRIPDDLSVMGFDNTALSEIFIPPMTTVGQPQYEIGFQAMQQLLLRLQGGQAQTIVAPHELICRKSTA